MIRCCVEPDHKSVFGLVLYWIDCNQLLSDQRLTVGVFNHTWSDVVLNLIRRVFLVRYCIELVVINFYLIRHCVGHDIFLIRSCVEPDQKSVFGLILYWIDCNQLQSDQRLTVGVFNRTWYQLCMFLVWRYIEWIMINFYLTFLITHDQMLCWIWSDECFWSDIILNWLWPTSIWSDIVWVTHDIFLIRCCFEPDQKSVFGLILYWIDCNQPLSDQRWTVGVFNHTWSDVVVNLIRRVFLVLLVWDEYFWNWLIRYLVFLMLCWTWSEECFWSGERDSWEWSESSSSRHTHLYFGVLLAIILGRL